MNYSIADIVPIIQADALSLHPAMIDQLLLDSRKVHSPATSLFFALKGPRRDGHQFIPELYKKGVRNFVVSEQFVPSAYSGANFLLVKDTLLALQRLAAHHRRRFDIPVIGITGSNGKTIVKEWLYQLLNENFSIVRSPKSYNSQTGVPLSVWQMNSQHNLAIFEAGISQPGEMERLEKIIQPTIGVLTNIGEAHSEGFSGREEKLLEKLKLFTHCEVVIGREDYLLPSKALIQSFESKPKLLSWGFSTVNQLIIKSIDKKESSTIITYTNPHLEGQITIPFTDDASIENAITVCLVSMHLNINNATREKGMKQLQSVNMRLELKKGINHCTIINDSYSADLSSLDIALNFLDQQIGAGSKTIILSDLLQTALHEDELYPLILDKLQKHKVTRLVGIGESISHSLQDWVGNKNRSILVELFSSTDSYLQQFRSTQFREEVILVKGARVFGFEKIVSLLEQKVHQTLLEINLQAIGHNLREYQKSLEPSTKVMAMVKAFAYGSGGAEIAGILQFHNVDYLGVAYTDEGVELRRSGISLPVMVMNTEANSFDAIAENNLEPELYSFELLEAFDAFLKKEGLKQYPVHIEIETGMNRLGFEIIDMEKLGDMLTATASFRVVSIFSHLAASEDPKQDAFTLEQYEKFQEAFDILRKKLGYPVLRHIANSAAIIRHPGLQMDMVRLGIGMYGVDNSGSATLSLQTVATLRSTVAQVKYLKAGESVSYNRRGTVDRNSVIATIRIGYADGYPRRLGNGVGRMYVKGRLAPVIGAVCMDMTMIDITDIPGIREGDEVIVFGQELPVQDLAKWAETIPYEIMTGIS
ncbi:MAG TPA: bifunctional UDP-N-acetylmuramoyl-tripeptide:D-alanyl-D-alanine ligase/alanine racemase, partial [Chitinophagaceae bacterium]|nr:bifunctional UDP-N-acetylmuramoyl-tripeptide:D-alanyl-D-alanine ligase/alanine racemase [Chitinophagaceae bacterium]